MSERPTPETERVKGSFYYHMKVAEPKNFRRQNPHKAIPTRLQEIMEGSFEQFVISESNRIKQGVYNRLCVKPYLLSPRFSRKADFVIRHENFQQDLEWVAKKFGLGDPEKAAPYNTTSRPKGGSYRDYYTSKRLVSLVAEVCEDTIELFEYKF